MTKQVHVSGNDATILQHLGLYTPFSTIFALEFFIHVAHPRVTMSSREKVTKAKFNHPR